MDLEKMKKVLQEWKENHPCNHDPVWAPLESFLPPEWISGFMYMGTHKRIFLYKHGITRRYLCLTPEGETYRFVGQQYVPTDPISAVLHVFDGTDPTVAYDEEYRANRNAALKAAGFAVITV